MVLKNSFIYLMQFAHDSIHADFVIIETEVYLDENNK